MLLSVGEIDVAIMIQAMVRAFKRLPHDAVILINHGLYLPLT